MIEHHHSMVYGKSKTHPKMVYGPNGEQHIVQHEGDPIPKGYKDHPLDHGEAKPVAPHVAAARAGSAPADAKAGDHDLDADGHEWNAELHAPTKTKTSKGLWRMNVGKTRPDPMPGFPKPAFDI